MGVGQEKVIVLVVILAALTLIRSPICVKDYQLLIELAKGSDAGPSNHTDFVHVEPNKVILIHNNNNNATTFTARVDIGLEALVENHYPLEPVSPVLPRRLFIVYGLESSGTTFTARTIATALGIREANGNDIFMTRNNEAHVHHISLPLGRVPPGKWGAKDRFAKPLPVMPVFLPNICRVGPVGKDPPKLSSTPQPCRDMLESQTWTTPYRFFVNMTSNIQWYRERGVRVYPIMVVRDPVLHFRGVLKQHCENASAAYEQYEYGRAIMTETIEKGLKPIIVSYETMLTVPKSYLRQLYRQLGIQSSYIPGFRNGNTKYVSTNTNNNNQTRRYVEEQLMKEDALEPVKNIMFHPNQRRSHDLLDKHHRLHGGTTLREDHLQRLKKDMQSRHQMLPSRQHQVPTS